MRLAFVRVLTAERDGINCANTMARAGLEMPKSTCSRHFQILRKAGVVRSQRRGIDLINFLRAEDLQGRFPGLLASILDASRAETAV